MNALRPFLRLAAGEWRWLALSSLLGLITLLAAIGLLTLAGWFITAAAVAGLGGASAALFDVFRPGALVRFCALARTAGRYGERLVGHEATLRLLAALRVWFFRRLAPLAPARLADYRGGDLLGRAVADIEALDNLYLRLLTPTINALLVSLLVTLLLWWYRPALAIIVLLALVLAGMVLPVGLARLGRSAGGALNRHSAELRARAVDHVQGLAELTASGAREWHLAGVGETQDALLAAQRRMSLLSGLGSSAMVLVNGLSLMALLYVGLGALANHSLSGAGLALAVFCLLSVFEAVLPLASAYQYLGQTLGAARRLREITDGEPAVWFTASTTRRPRDAAVVLDHVSFGYSDRPLLRDVSLRISDGERIALLGPSGAGKSTLAALLVRFFDPDQGCIALGGVALTELPEAELRRQVSLLPQRPHIFNTSIRDNLLLAKPEAAEGELWAVLAAVELAAVVEHLPQGLDSFCGEFGTQLSGGQARRLALARLLLRPAPVVILDEPAESLDAVTERVVMRTLEKSLAGHTVMLIGHRLAGLERFDRIVVLEEGHIVEQGSHAALLELGERYATLQASFRRDPPTPPRA